MTGLMSPHQAMDCFVPQGLAGVFLCNFLIAWPQRAEGGLDWSLVTAVEVMRVEDTHG